MRIEKIRFKNLNSLYGEWEIDLTDQSYVTEGLFAITGPTGAGKTTILDAICLALYARTPRLEAVNKSDNEIITRRTPDCKAEVIFRTQAGRYLAQWTQKRGYGKIDGKLQNASHTLAELGEGETQGRIIANAISRTPAVVGEITGLDYRQFTRSTLLAQGAFSAFLQATSSERAPILEQITGTGVYSQISIRAHKRWSAEKKNIEEMEKVLGVLKLLTPEEEEALKREAAALEARLTSLEAQIAEKGQHLAWRESLGTLEAEIASIGELRVALEREMAAFEPSREKLELALKVMVLAGDHSALTLKRQERTRAFNELARVRTEIPALAEAKDKAQAQFDGRVEFVNSAKAKLEEFGPVAAKVRKLDVLAQETEDRLAKAKSGQAKLKAETERLAKEAKNKGAKKASLEAEAAAVAQRLSDGAGDESLAERLPLLKAKADAGKKLSATITAKRAEAKT
ncbi:MAG: AAA family ATPase, partial [Deltaproteobacteria bacterium]|nr:AAA family ATPase [Deltaproteobacteria bacterium]